MDLDSLFKISYGMYIVSSENGGRYNGCLINTLCQVNSDPPTFLVVVNKNNLTHTFIESKKIYSVSVLSEETPFQYLGRFGFRTGRDFNKFENIRYEVTGDNIPVPLDYSIATLICNVNRTVDMGTHSIFIGDLLDCNLTGPGNPMTYAYYHDVIKGKTAKNASTYQNRPNE